ncbi:hypothetical protein QOZ80_4AG0310660 [Eleusine coracana subsp. coracana]|nr:hypothetical protein QOZ80_4AG0310660 [Eleusine coracana subsp. coracana]
MEEKLLADASSDDDANPLPSCLSFLAAVATLLLALVLLVVGALCIVAPIVFLVAAIVCLTVGCLDPNPYRAPEIRAVVDGCSGLDGARVPRAFNLTITVDNPDATNRVCLGGAAEVLYAGVPLAAGLVDEDLCVPPQGAGRVAARAASGGVGLPSELAAMMEEERRAAGGVARLEVRVFSVELRLSYKCVVGLGRAGAAAASLPSSPCSISILSDESDGLVKPINPTPTLF